MQRAKDVSKQLLAMCKRVGIDVDAPPPTLPPTLPAITSNANNSNAVPAGADADSPAALPLSVRVRRALLAGFFFHAAKLEGDSYRTVKTRQQVYVHPSSCLAIKYVLYNLITGVMIHNSYYHVLCSYIPSFRFLLS